MSGRDWRAFDAELRARVPELAVTEDGDGREYIIPQKKAPQGTRGR